MEEYKRKLIQVFNYAKALNEVKNPIVNKIEHQKWSLWLKDLPNHESIDYIDITNEVSSENEVDSKDYILRVRRPDLTECPVPPEEIIKFIEGNWKDIDKKVKLITEVKFENEQYIEKVEISDEITIAFELWYEERNQWVLVEKPARASMDVFQQLYKIYSDIEKEAETIELVAGDGILKWIPQNGRDINHPVLLQNVELEFDPQIPEFRIILGNKESELYSALWRNVEDVNSTAMSHCIEHMDKHHPSIIDSNATDEFLISLSTALSSNGRFTKNCLEVSSNNEPVIIRDQVLFLRKRNLGFSVALESILEDINDNEHIPPFLKKVVGFNEKPIDDISDEPEISSVNINGEDEDILFTKPSNTDQLLVAKHLERSNAVLVQGPPGTGKTHTIANLVGHLLAQGKSILITSHSEKALKVLRDKIVDPLKPLCLPVLTENRKTNELEKTLDAMNEKRSSINKVLLEQQISALDLQRKELIKSLKQKRESLKKEIHNEYREIIFGGEEYSPREAAKFIVENKEGNDWIPSPVEFGSAITLNNNEIIEVYRSNTSISEQEEKECQYECPEIYSLISPNEFQELISNYKSLIKMDLQFRQDLWTNESQEVEQIEKILKDMTNTIKIIDETNPWSLEIVQDAYDSGTMKEEWVRLIQTIDNLYNESIKFKKLDLEFAPSIKEDANNAELKLVLQEMHDFVKDNKKISKVKLLTKPKWSKALAKVSVNSKVPTVAGEFQTLILYFELNQMREKVLQRWDRQVTAIGGPNTEKFGKAPEFQLKQHAAYIQDRLDWYEKKWKPLVKTMECIGFKWSDFTHEDKEIHAQFTELKNLKNKVTLKLGKILQAQINRIKYKNVEKQFNDLARIVGMYTIGQYNEKLMASVKNKDTEQYNEAYKLIKRMYECRVIKSRRYGLINRLGKVAPEWASNIKFRVGIHGGEDLPGEINLAWKWRQLNDELDRRGAVSIKLLQEEINAKEASLRKISVDLADKKAWLKKIQSITLEQTQAIEGWKLTLKSIGAGTGKKVPMLMAKSRELAAKCQDAVPVWIMPLSTVVNNFNPKVNKFDVVIIDEASQADILAITALYMAKQVVIVGDDEQVSPLAVGTKIDDYQNLINTYLKGIPNAHLYTPQFSIYDLAKTAGFQPVCLKEHFRCVAPIIQFSNHLSYKGTVMPLRDDSNVLCKPPLANYRVDSKEYTDKTNRDEAEAIVSLIVSSMKQPEYKNKTFGVISLLGEEQVRVIEELLQKKVDPAEYKRAKLLCGTSSQFQGDERDVIFISLVNTPKYDGPLSLKGNGAQDMMKKRFNVAASRACDQLWVVHSLNPDRDLKDGDLRLRLIRHAQNPFAMDNDINNLKQRAESEFEIQVSKRLRQAGYKVIPQWKVGAFRIDMVVEGDGKRLAVECDGEKYHGVEKLEDDMKRQAILERLGWTFVRIRGSKFFRNPDEAMKDVFDKLEQMEIPPVEEQEALEYQNNEIENNELLNRVKASAEDIRKQWSENDSDITKSNNDSTTSWAAVSLESHNQDSLSLFKKNSTENQNTLKTDIERKMAKSVKTIEDKKQEEPLILKREARKIPNTIKKQDTSSKSTKANKIKKDEKPDQVSIFEITDKLNANRDNLQTYNNESVIVFLKEKGLKVIDKRKNGGCLWVVGGKELSQMFKEISKEGPEFTFTEKGGRATGHMPAWYCK